MPSIREHGLMSTSALVDLFEVNGPERESIESNWRRASVPIYHAVHGTAVVRDQKPMPPAALRKCLEARLEPAVWYRIVNGKVFFWPSIDRLERFRSRYPTSIVLTLDTGSLLSDPALTIWVTRINSGSAVRKPAPRGPSTFVPVADAHDVKPIAEVAVDYAVPRVMRHVVAVEPRR